MSTNASTETVEPTEAATKSVLVIRIPLPSKKTLAVAGASLAAGAAVVAVICKLRSEDSDCEDGYVAIGDSNDSFELVAA